MTGNHGKFYSYKIYIKYPCGDSLFSQTTK